MLNIDHSKPGAQASTNSWAEDPGVDCLKLDGVGPSKTADVTAWPNVLKQTAGRSR